MSTIQQFLRIHTLIKITASGNKIVMPQNMLALLPSMNVAGYVVQRGTCGFCTVSIGTFVIDRPRIQLMPRRHINITALLTIQLASTGMGRCGGLPALRITAATRVLLARLNQQTFVLLQPRVKHMNRKPKVGKRDIYDQLDHLSTLIDIAHVRLNRVYRARHCRLHLCLPFRRQLRARQCCAGHRCCAITRRAKAFAACS